MNIEHRKEIMLALLNTYIISVRHCCPGESERKLYHRLIDATKLTGHNVFECRNDGRHFVANIKTADETCRVLTMFDNPLTGRPDIDLTNNLPLELDDYVFMTLYKMLAIAISVTVSELVSHTKTHQSPLALQIVKQAANQ